MERYLTHQSLSLFHENPKTLPTPLQIIYERLSFLQSGAYKLIVPAAQRTPADSTPHM